MGRTILVVEDDADIQETFRLVLEDEGFAVATAANGREALSLLETGLDPCVVLVDLMMPVMNGWELIERMRGSVAFATLPVVVVTAAGDAQGMPTGVSHTLRKPVRLEKLLEIVSTTCR